MSTKKLYAVEVLFRYYAHAESADEAESWAMECARQADLPECASAVVVPHADCPLNEGWSRDDFVFHRGPRPILLGELLDALPRRPERKHETVAWSETPDGHTKTRGEGDCSLTVFLEMRGSWGESWRWTAIRPVGDWYRYARGSARSADEAKTAALDAARRLADGE